MIQWVPGRGEGGYSLHGVLVVVVQFCLERQPLRQRIRLFLSLSTTLKHTALRLSVTPIFLLHLFLVFKVSYDVRNVTYSTAATQGKTLRVCTVGRLRL